MKAAARPETKVFVDTSAWISLVAAKDPYHEPVAKEWLHLLDAQALLVTTADVLSETITHLRYHAGHALALQFYSLAQEAEAQHRLQIHWVDQAVFAQAWRIFASYSDQAFSVTDCTSFAVCQREGIRTALTLDRHFRIMGLAVRPELSVSS